MSRPCVLSIAVQGSERRPAETVAEVVTLRDLAHANELLQHGDIGSC